MQPLEDSVAMPQKGNMELPYDPAISLLSISPKEREREKAVTQTYAYPCSGAGIYITQ